jgi:hypothetical protein
LLLLVAFNAQAALIDTYLIDSQSELDYLYESGQIDLEQFQLLDEFFATRYYGDSSDLDEIARVLSAQAEYQFIGLDSLSFKDEGLDSITAEASYLAFLQKLKFRLAYRLYQNVASDDTRRQLVTLSGHPAKKIDYYFEAEKNQESGDFFLRKRGLSITSGDLEMEFGNYIPSRGMGITLGYHSGFLNKDDNPTYQSALFPIKGHYNGINLEYNSTFAPTLILSYDRSKNMRGRLAAFGCDYVKKNLRIGLLGQYHYLENWETGSDYSNFIAGMHFQYSRADYKFQGEISESERRYFAWIFQADRKFPNGSFSLSGWNYHSGYINPYGGGKANSDYVTLEIEQTGLQYRSRQNGEWGILILSKYDIYKAHSIAIDANYWRDGGCEKKVRARFSDKIRLGHTLEGVITYLWGDDNLDLDYGQRQHLRLDLLYRKNPILNLRLSLQAERVHYSYGRRDYLRGEMKTIFPVGNSVFSTIKISRVNYYSDRVLPGYWLVYFSENLMLGKNVTLRAVLDSREGKEYNLLNSARFNLQLTLMGG